MPKTVCRICLRSENAENEDTLDDTLVEFHDELCENDVATTPALKFCLICEHQLRKFYNFRQSCRRANKVLKTWTQTNMTESPEHLHDLILPPSISNENKCASPKLMEFTHSDIESTEVIIKLETVDTNAKIENSTIVAEEIRFDLQSNVFQNNDSHSVGLGLKIEQDSYYCKVDVFNNDFDDNDDDYEPGKRTTSKSKNIKSNKIRKKNKPERKTRSMLKYRDIDEDVLSVKEELNLDVREKIKAKRKKVFKNQTKLKDRILELLERGEFKDLGENVTMGRELFLKMFEKYPKSGLRSTMSLKPGSSEEQQSLRKFLLYLLKKNNPEYEEMFHIELLDTDAKKLAEFDRRKLRKEYIDAEYKCERCFKVFDVQRLLDYHNRWHEPGTGSHVCDICAMRFARRKALAQHLKNNHYTVYRCKLCPLLTYSSAVMVSHYNQHKGTEYSCPVCLSVFSNKSTLNNHRLQAHKTSHICALCARCFVSEKGLYLHKRLKHKDELATKSEESVSCDKCDATLTSPEVLLTHIRQMHGSAHTIHKCFHCKEIFSSLEELKKHKVDLNHQRPPRALSRLSTKVSGKIKGDVPLNDSEKPTCAECGKMFNSRKSYLRHVNINHKINRIHKCGFCQAKFSSAEELDSHRTAYNHHRKVRYVKKQKRNKPGTEKRLKCNDPEKPFEKCELCEEMISTARTNTMYQHFQAAHADTPYASVYAQPHNRHLCEECGKTFKDLRFFIDHKNLHTGEKPYACKLCPRAYATKRHLSLHAERHGPPRHQCKECGKMFNSAGNLFAHRRGHVGDRRFKCEICAKGFLHQAALNEHVRGVHNHIRRARKCTDK